MVGGDPGHSGGKHMSGGVSPCKGCSDRTRACHDTCYKYKAWSTPERLNKVFLHDWLERECAKTKAAEKRHIRAQKRFGK